MLFAIFLSIIFYSFANPHIESSMVPFTLVMVISLIGISKSILLNWGGIHEQVFWLFCFIWLGLAPVIQISRSVLPLPLEITRSDFAMGGWLIVFGLLAYSLPTIFPRMLERSTKNFINRNEKVQNTLALIAIGLSVLILVEIGPQNYFVSRQQLNQVIFIGRGSDNSQGAILSNFSSVPIFVSLIVFLVEFRVRPAIFQSTFKKILFILLILLNIIVNNPISQSRFWFTTVWGSVFLTLVWGKRNIAAWISLFSMIFALFIFPVSAIFRYTNQDSGFRLQNPAISLSTGDFDAAEQIAWGMKLSDETGFLKGRQILGAALFAVPRGIWPEKPQDSGIILAKKANYKNTSLSAPIWVEGYLDGGWFISIFYLFGIGLTHRKMREYYSQNVPNLLIIFIPYQVVLLRGSLIQSMSSLSIILLWILLNTTRSKI
jgi:hypothetical protein